MPKQAENLGKHQEQSAVLFRLLCPCKNKAMKINIPDDKHFQIDEHVTLNIWNLLHSKQTSAAILLCNE